MPTQLPAVLFDRLADLVGKEIIAELIATDGAMAAIRARLERADTVDNVLYLRFCEHAGGTRLIVPGDMLLEIGRATDDPMRLVLRFCGNEVALKDMSQTARIAHGQHAISRVRELADLRARQGQLALLAAMIRSERDASDNAHLRGGLNAMLDELRSIGAFTEPVGADDLPDDDRDPGDELWDW